MENELIFDLYCRCIRSSEELHVALAALLNFPAYYGRNYDALRDCLADKALETPFLLRIHGWDTLEEQLGLPRCVALRHVLQDCTEECSFSYAID